MSHPPYRRRSDHDSRTLPTISTPRARSCTPIQPPHNHHSTPSLRTKPPPLPTSIIPDYLTHSPRPIPYVDAATLAKLLSSDRDRSIPRRPYVLSDLSNDRLQRFVRPSDLPLPDGPRPPQSVSSRQSTTYSETSSWHPSRRTIHLSSHPPLPHHPHATTKPSGISWHRPTRQGPPRTNPSSTPTTATSSGAATPVVHHTTTPVSPARITSRPKERKFAYHRSRRAASVIGTEPAHFSPFHSVVEEKPKSGNARYRRRSSLLTPGFTSRKLSAFSWMPDHLRDIPADSVFDHQPIHPFVPLAPFGHHATCDMILLYTNSVRAELNDLVFLIGCLQHSLADPLKKKKQHKNLETDFRIWYQWFAQFTVQILRGFEDFFFPLVTQLLEQRDVMISRTRAVIEAKGVSYPQAWSTTTSELFQKMEEVRDSLSTVHSRLFRLQQKPGDAEDAARATVWYACFDTIAKLVPATVDLLSQLDHSIAAIVSLKIECKKGLRKMYRDFAVLMIREGSPMLGWSAVTGLTRWIKDRKTRSQQRGALTRAGRESVFSRYRADHSHENIVRAHRIRVFDEQRRAAGRVTSG